MGADKKTDRKTATHLIKASTGKTAKNFAEAQQAHRYVRRQIDTPTSSG